MLSIDPRSGTVNVEMWGQSGLNGTSTGSGVPKHQAQHHSANVSQVTTARTQHSHVSKTGELQESLSQLRANTSLDRIDLRKHRKSVDLRNAPTRNVQEKYHQGDNTSPEFRRFYEVILEEPQRRRQDRQRQAPTAH
ncbi:unnamed protein product [Coregonus sp. 'balchen']|nr:unnamed protein product [Coregonus sp. 'balchen']